MFGKEQHIQVMACALVIKNIGSLLPKQRNLQYSISMAPLPPEYQTFSIRSGFVYKTCGFNIILSRGRSQIFFQVYLTSAIVSWLSFIIKPEVVPGRIALLVTTFLVLVNVFNSAKSQAPVSEHLNAIDVYLNQI